MPNASSTSLLLAAFTATGVPLAEMSWRLGRPAVSNAPKGGTYKLAVSEVTLDVLPVEWV